MKRQFVEYVLRDRVTSESVTMRIEFVAGGKVAETLPLTREEQLESCNMWGFDLIHSRRGEFPDDVPPSTVDPHLGG